MTDPFEAIRYDDPDAPALFDPLESTTTEGPSK